MLPLPPIRITRKWSLRDLIRRIDSYTLWAFNPDVLLDDRGSSTRTGNRADRNN